MPGWSSSINSLFIGVHVVRPNSISVLFAAFFGVVRTAVARCNENPLIIASASHLVAVSLGIMMEIFPSEVSSSLAFAKNCSGDRVSLCLARLRCLSSHFRLFSKNGGLLTIVSNGSLGV